MARVIETTVFTFDELNDKAKAKARDWYRQASASDTYFAESIIEDAASLADLMGITLRQIPVKTIGGQTRHEPAINWSGFAAQGSGASFEGEYASLETGTALDRVKDYAPTDEKLHTIAMRLDALQVKYGKRLAATVTEGHRYCHSAAMSVEPAAIDAEGDDIDVAPDDARELTETMRAFADWIYRQLESAYDDENSDENIDEVIRINEYEFTADGKREG